MGLWVFSTALDDQFPHFQIHSPFFLVLFALFAEMILFQLFLTTDMDLEDKANSVFNLLERFAFLKSSRDSFSCNCCHENGIFMRNIFFSEVSISTYRTKVLNGILFYSTKNFNYYSYVFSTQIIVYRK